MAKSLKIQIEMAGAEEIKRQLEGVGEAGEEAFNKILNAAKQAGGFKELDPSFLKQTFDELGSKAPEAIGKITQAVQSATKMETLVNALTSVENGLGKVQAAASSLDAVLGRALLNSISKVARLLPAAFAAATAGSIALTTKSILELDAAAIKLGISIGDLSKAEEAFKGIGLGAKEVAKGVGDFFEKLNLEAVKKAIEEAETSVLTFRGLAVLQRAAQGVGEAADLARKKLAEMGKLDTVLSPAARAIEDIKKSTLSMPDQLLAIVRVLEMMGNTAERDRIIFANFDKDFGVRLIQILNAGIPLTAQLVRELAGITPATQEAANAATRLSLEWGKWKNLLAGGFAISPEGLNTLAEMLRLIRENIVAFGELKVVAGTLNIGGNTLRELETILTVLASIGTGMKFVGDSIIAGFTIAFQSVIAGAQLVVQAVLGFFGQLPSQIAGFFAGIGETLWQGIVSSAQQAWNDIVGFIQKAINKAKEFVGIRASGAGAGAGAAAHGGIIGGRGTGTSDSNLAWLSRGEHIMPARAVRQPGVLQLLEALRRSGGNLRGVLDRMGHFALGGMVGVPTLAAGGVNGMSHVTIQFPGVQPIGGLRASSAVVDELRRAAALAQVRSGGRKPSRYS